MGSLPILLASGSPRRRELLASLGLSFTVRAADVDETVLPGESPDQLVARLALSKASAAAQQEARALVIGADTVVSVQGEILGKPKDASQAFSHLQKLAGSSHTVYTGVAVLLGQGGISDVRVSSTKVFFREMTDSEIEAYIRTGEPMDKAGAYAIQGIGATLVRRIEGDYFTVVGLPLCMLSEMLSKVSQPILGATTA